MHVVVVAFRLAVDGPVSRRTRLLACEVTFLGETREASRAPEVLVAEVLFLIATACFFIFDARTDSEDLEHPRSGATKYDDGEYDYDEHSCAHGLRVFAFETRGKSYTDSSAEARPKEHHLV